MAEQPSAPQPVAKPGVTAETPKPAAPAVEAKPAPADDLKPRFEELTRQERHLALERQKFSKEREQAKADAAKDKAELEEYRQLRADRLRNPGKYLTKDYGDDWYNKLTKYQLEGAPPADLIASELDERTSQIRKETTTEVDKLRNELKQRDADEAVRAKREYEQGAIQFAKSSPDKFPLINEFKEYGTIPGVIAQHYQESAAKGKPELWSHEEACAEVEKRLATVESLFEARFKKKHGIKDAPAAPAKRNEPPQRRTLSNDMTAPSEDWTPPKDDRERMARVNARLDAMAAARTNGVQH